MELLKYNLDTLFIKLAISGNEILLRSLNNMIIKLSKKQQKQILQVLEYQGIEL